MIRNPDNHMPMRRFRMGDEWHELGDLVGDRGRSEVVRELIRWYLRKPGAKQPKRPEPPTE